MKSINIIRILLAISLLLSSMQSTAAAAGAGESGHGSGAGSSNAKGGGKAKKPTTPDELKAAYDAAMKKAVEARAFAKANPSKEAEAAAKKANGIAHAAFLAANPAAAAEAKAAAAAKSATAAAAAAAKTAALKAAAEAAAAEDVRQAAEALEAADARVSPEAAAAAATKDAAWPGRGKEGRAPSGETDEGWRWQRTLNTFIGGNLEHFNRVHNLLLNAESEASNLWKDLQNTIRTRGGKDIGFGNLALASLTIIYSMGDKEYTVECPVIDTENHKIFFESGNMESILPAAEGYRIETPLSDGSRVFVALDKLGDTEIGLLEDLDTFYEQAIKIGLGRPSRDLLIKLQAKVQEDLSEYRGEGASAAAAGAGAAAAASSEKSLDLIHSEQLLRLYLKKEKHLKTILAPLARLPVGARITGAVLHIHTRGDMCPRCALTWSTEMYASQKPGINSVFSEIFSYIGTTFSGRISIAPTPKVLLLVSSRDLLGKRPVDDRPSYDAPALPRVPIAFEATPILAFHRLPYKANTTTAAAGSGSAAAAADPARGTAAAAAAAETGSSVRRGEKGAAAADPAWGTAATSAWGTAAPSGWDKAAASVVRMGRITATKSVVTVSAGASAPAAPLHISSSGAFAAAGAASPITPKSHKSSQEKAPPGSGGSRSSGGSLRRGSSNQSHNSAAGSASEAGKGTRKELFFDPVAAYGTPAGARARAAAVPFSNPKPLEKEDE